MCSQGELQRTELRVSLMADQFYDATSAYSSISRYHSFRKSTRSSKRNTAIALPSRPLNERVRRSEIPPKPNNSSLKALFVFLKNSIGKDLTRVPVPATFFSEPLSFLQRAAECFEYSSLLDKAAACTDSHEQMTYVAAFCISEYSTYYERIVKPFNPLLNETFEFDRRSDYGWRLLSEQVSHHPPHFAMV